MATKTSNGGDDGILKQRNVVQIKGHKPYSSSPPKEQSAPLALLNVQQSLPIIEGNSLNIKKIQSSTQTDSSTEPDVKIVKKSQAKKIFDNKFKNN